MASNAASISSPVTEKLRLLSVARNGEELFWTFGVTIAGNVVDGDVFHDAAIHFLQSQSAAAAKGAIRDGNVSEAAIGLGAKFDAAIAIGRRLHCSIEQGAFQKAGDLAIHDGEILGNHRPTQRQRTLGTQSVISRRIDATIGDRRVAATVNVNPVTVGIHRDVIYGQAVAGRANQDRFCS